MIKNTMTYKEALGTVADLIEDCTSPEWDFNHDRNWESMIAMLERLKVYITLEHVRKTV